MASKAELEQWFAAFDVNGDGMIERSELKSVVKAYYDWQKVPANEAKINADVASIMKEIDTSGDGKISKTEFFKYFAS